jgi:hypothetical protein
MRSLRRSARILLVAGIVSVLVFLATRTNESRVRAPAPEPNAGLVETRRELDAAAEEAPSPSRDRSVVSPLDGEAPSEFDESVGWRVCVVDARTNAAVAGATVSVLDSYAIAREISDRGIGYDTIDGLRLRRERAVEAKTGTDGCTRFSAPPEHATVEARLGANWAFTVVNQVPDDRCVTLRLAPDREFLVRVVDAAGTPVGGVPVALRRRVNAKPSFTWKCTDTQPGTGLAMFLHFQRRLEQGAGWHALFAFPVRDQTLIPVDEGTTIEPPITLVLPDTGRVRVRVRTPEGNAPDLEGVDLQLDAFEREAGGARLWPDGPWARPRIDARGEALAPWIGLGLQIKAALILDDDEVVARSIVGPARPGEEVTCELVLSRPSPHVVTGRFVLRDGRAWPAATVNANATIFPVPSRWPRTRAIEVQSDGRFRMPVHEARPANGTRSFRFSAPHPGGLGEVIAIVPLDQAVPPEGLDLGDVLLDHGDLLVSGRVADAARQPITGASFSVGARAVASGKALWPGIQFAGIVRSTQDGEFALYLPSGETQPSEELRLTTRAKGFAAECDRDVRRGDRNVEVVLTQAGALAGSLELDHGLAHDDVTLFLTSETRQFVPLRPDATFEVLELLPGMYSLEVRRRGANGRPEREPAALVGGLLVRAGETCRDPRIQKLRIGSVLTTLRIRVVDRASTPLNGAAISVVGLADARPAMSKDDGLCLVRCEALPVDLEVSAFGYLRQRLVGVSADREAVLDAGFPIRLRTSTQPSGSEPKYMLGALLFSVDANGVRRGLAWGPEYTTDYTTERGHFDEHGELALRMPAAGVYECDISVTVLGDDHVGRGAPVELSPKPRITVLASTTEQLFELAIPQRAVQEALEVALR